MPEARARRKGGVGGIPPRPSVPPERSGGGQFRSKKVRAFSKIGHQKIIDNCLLSLLHSDEDDGTVVSARVES